MCFYKFFYWIPKVLDWDSVSKSNDSNLGWKNAMRTSLIRSIFPKQANRYIHRSAVSQCYERRPEETKQNQKTTLIGIFNML